jgi:hypothetical protein
MFSAKLNLYKPFSRLITKNRLLTLDVIYKAQPFVDVVSSNQNTYNLDTVYKAQPFVGTPNNYIKTSISTTNNPDVDIWLNTVALNGGSVSSTTVSALNTFCNSINNAGLRNKFYRLNLFCGDNFNSCVVPLYSGPSRSSIQLGFGADRNINYSYGTYNTGNDINDDFTYSENQGLLGSTQALNTSVSRRFLDTGLKLNILNSNNIHYSFYCNNLTTGGYALGVTDGVNTGFTLNVSSSDFYTGVFSNPTLTYSNSSSPKSYSSNKGLYVSTHNDNILSIYEGRGSRLGYRDISSSPLTIPSIVSVTVFSENRPSAPLFNFINRLQGYSIGLALSQSEIETYYDIMQTFQTALNRNV